MITDIILCMFTGRRPNLANYKISPMHVFRRQIAIFLACHVSEIFQSGLSSFFKKSCAEIVRSTVETGALARFCTW